MRAIAGVSIPWAWVKREHVLLKQRTAISSQHTRPHLSRGSFSMTPSHSSPTGCLYRNRDTHPTRIFRSLPASALFLGEGRSRIGSWWWRRSPPPSSGIFGLCFGSNERHLLRITGEVHMRRPEFTSAHLGGGTAGEGTMYSACTYAGIKRLRPAPHLSVVHE